MCNLCIDVGSTFVKFFVYDGNSIVFSDRLDFPKPCVNDGVFYEVPIRRIDELVLRIFERVTAFNVNKCFIAVQMHGYVLKNQDGVFSNYVSWKDKRGDIANPLLQSIDFEQNGTSLKSNLPAVKLICTRNEGEFFTLGSYIAFLLTGANVTHTTDGCASGFFRADTLEPIPLPMSLSLPRVTHAVLPIGAYNGVQIYTPVGDHQLSFLGSGADDDGYLLNIGTATQISTLSDEYVRGTPFEKRPYFTRSRLLTVSGLTGGEKLFDGYSIDDFAREVLSAIEKLPPKSRMFIGGGGANLVYEGLKERFEDRDVECVKLYKNISEEGLITLAAMCDTNIGTMLSEVCFPNFPIILKNENVDFLIVDNEHGAFDYGFLSSIVMNARLVGLPLIVRLPDNNRKDITKLVDMGVTGFLLPMTNDADGIKKVVDFSKYAPVGRRGLSTNRAHTLYNPPPLDEYMPAANERVKVYAQIETRQGIENIDEILSVNGVDGVFVGPNDLSCDLDCIGNNAPIKEAIETIAVAAKRQNKGWGIITTSRELIDCSLENHANFISYGSEINMLKNACKKIRGTVYG